MTLSSPGGKDFCLDYRAGFEPATGALIVRCSATELTVVTVDVLPHEVPWAFGQQNASRQLGVPLPGT